MTDTPKSLLEAVRYYTDPRVCFETMLTVKWPDGKIVCPKCNCEQVGVIRSRSMLQCKSKECRKQFSVKVGTIFEDSPLGLDKWFVAVWCIANAKNGISSLELGRALDVTQKTAWFMLHRIRHAMKTKSFRKLQGEIESDETFIGGKARNMHAHKREKKIKGRGAIGKAIIQGLLERTQGEDVSEFESVIGSPIIAASESHDDLGKPGEYADSWTWTQQRIRTANGEINIVWLGESNGYYGETLYFCRTHEMI